MNSNELPIWRAVVDKAVEFLKTSTAPAEVMYHHLQHFPQVRCHLLWQPELHKLHVGLDKSAAEWQVKGWENKAERLGFNAVVGPIDAQPAGFGEQPWVWLKYASDPVIATAAKLLNYQPSAINKVIGGPSPLAAALTSGLLGAGIGYGVGALGEQLLPQSDFNHGTLRRNMAVAGGLVGAAPGVLWGAAAHKAHPQTPGLRAWLSSWPFRDQDIPATVKKAVALLRQSNSKDDNTKRAWFNDNDDDEGMFGQGLDHMATLPMIPKDDFGRVVWGDPNTPIHIRAATMGLVNTASMANNNSPFVSPWDIASVTATGAARGLLVGKTLGVLAGLKPESQANLQRAGVWGGMLQAVVPNAFPNPYRSFS